MVQLPNGKNLIIGEKANEPVPPGMVYLMRQPKLPQFVFEWHPNAKNLYVIDERAEKRVAHIIAEGCVENQGHAHMFSTTWMRGYLTGLNPEEHTRKA